MHTILVTSVNDGWRRAFLATATASLFLVGCEEAPPPEVPVRPVISMIVGDAERFRTDVYPGRAKATQEVNVAFEVSGKMIERRVDVGDKVKQGDVLAVLEPDRFESEVKRLSADLAAAEARVVNTQQQLERQEKLLNEGFSTQARVDTLTSAARQARAQFAALEAAVSRAKLELSYTMVAAPFDGTVSETFVENFQNVIAKQPILRLLDTSQIEMEVSVPESLIGLAPYVQEVSVRFKSLPDVEIPATIKEISNEASLTTRTYPVTIIMDQPEGTEINPGMAGQAKALVQLPGNWDENGVEIPLSAMFSPGDTSADQIFVWVVDEAKKVVVRRQVEMLNSGSRGAIVKGVNAGERVITAGVSYLKEGQTVRLLSE